MARDGAAAIPKKGKKRKGIYFTRALPFLPQHAFPKGVAYPAPIMIHLISQFGKSFFSKGSVVLLYKALVNCFLAVPHKLLNCPVCNGALIKHAKYTRGLVCLKEQFLGAPITTLNTNQQNPGYGYFTDCTTIAIQRVKCKEDGSTHALLPEFIAPFETCHLVVILTVLALGVKKNTERGGSIEDMCFLFGISTRTYYTWKEQFNDLWKSKLYKLLPSCSREQAPFAILSMWYYHNWVSPQSISSPGCETTCNTPPGKVVQCPPQTSVAAQGGALRCAAESCHDAQDTLTEPLGMPTNHADRNTMAKDTGVLDGVPKSSEAQGEAIQCPPQASVAAQGGALRCAAESCHDAQDTFTEPSNMPADHADWDTTAKDTEAQYGELKSTEAPDEAIQGPPQASVAAQGGALRCAAESCHGTQDTLTEPLSMPTDHADRNTAAKDTEVQNGELKSTEAPGEAMQASRSDRATENDSALGALTHDVNRITLAICTFGLLFLNARTAVKIWKDDDMPDRQVYYRPVLIDWP